MGDQGTLMQVGKEGLPDNAHCHTPKHFRGWFEEHDKDLKVLAWLPNSPDLNLIVHLWDVLEQQADQCVLCNLNEHMNIYLKRHRFFLQFYSVK